VKLPEYRAKALLAEWGIPVPDGRIATSPAEAKAVAAELGGPVVVKAQVLSGGRGKAGGIVLAATPAEAAGVAERLLAMTLADEPVEIVLIEQGVDIAAEHYLSVTVDTSAGCAVIMRSTQGGVEVESMTDAIERIPISAAELDRADLDPVAAAAAKLFFDLDALLVEINPLAVTVEGEMIALDAKIELDDAARFRHRERFDALTDERGPAAGTEREQAAAELGLRLIELGGDVAVLANGAGLTMATMDAIVAAGGEPANFLEIGGDAYTKAVPALELVLSQPGVRSLLVNFCGAFARCDVMTEGVVAAWKTLQPDIPVAFSISGTGMDEAIEIVRSELGIEPHPSMAAAVAAAVAGTGAGAEAGDDGSES